MDSTSLSSSPSSSNKIVKQHKRPRIQNNARRGKEDLVPSAIERNDAGGEEERLEGDDGEREEDDENYHLQAPVLPVSCEFSDDELKRRMDMGFPAATAGEYLSRVRLEASKIPDIMVSNVDPRQFDKYQTVFVPKIEGIARPPPGMEPSQEWRYQVLNDFNTLQSKLVQRQPAKGNEGASGTAQKITFPGYQDEKSWLAFLGILDDLDGASHTKLKDKKPYVGVMNQFDQVRTNKALLHISRFLGRPEVSGRLLGPDTQWSSHTLMWIFALMAKLEEPYAVATISVLRSIAKFISYSRTKLSTVAPSIAQAMLQPMNLIVCIVEDHFKQGDSIAIEPSEPPPPAQNQNVDDLYFEAPSEAPPSDLEEPGHSL